MLSGATSRCTTWSGSPSRPIAVCAAWSACATCAPMWAASDSGRGVFCRRASFSAVRSETPSTNSRTKTGPCSSVSK